MEPYLGQITLYGCNFPPRGWALCQGQLMAISQNSALFSLLGTYYGGNGVSNFGLPDLRGRTGLNLGQPPGGQDYVIGEQGGVENVTLTTATMATHNHGFVATTAAATTPTASGNQLGVGQAGNPIHGLSKANIYSPNAVTTPLAPNALGTAGNNLPHNNLQPYLALNYCIALQGTYPARN
jgi:microcystin-dependent protein